MFLLSLEEKGHALFCEDDISAATMTMKLQPFVMHTIMNIVKSFEIYYPLRKRSGYFQM